MDLERILIDRRRFLRAGASAAALASVAQYSAVSARARGGAGADDYRALVCVFLYGGADTFNLLVPASASGYATYAASRGDLAETRASLLPITPVGIGAGEYGVHGSCPELQTLFETGKLAFVGNVGPLVEPTTKAEYLGNQRRIPPYLFSHNDQQRQWQIARASGSGEAGWAGRLLDGFPFAGGPSSIPPGIGVEQTAQLLNGNRVSPFVVGTEGPLEIDGYEASDRRAVRDALLAADPHPLAQALKRTTTEAVDIANLLGTELAGAPTFETLFGQGPLEEQLRIVARLISIRSQLGVGRQVFFVGMGGFDTHDSQTANLPGLFAQVSRALSGFQNAMEQIGEAQRVTAFTHTEFGRTLSSNGQGSDHGWGGHAMVMGGAVQGQRLFGTMPDLSLDGPDDVGEGRILPTTSVDQLAATLSRWFGATPSELGAVFPNLGNFQTSDLGFLA
ncbi:MAG: DUF1501 domain-containing protein [Planctomycetota bacterium]